MPDRSAPALDRRPTGARRIRVLWNQAAGSKGGLPTNTMTAEDLRTLMHEHDLGSELVAATSEEHTVAAARAAVADGYDVVVAAGGDGTVGTVARELMGTDVALGILPLGSVMNIARSLGLPRDPSAAARIVRTGTIRAIDVGEANGRPFFEAGSIGMNAAMFREAQRFDDGDWASIVRTIWVAIRYRPARMHLELDEDVVRTRALMVVIANGPYTGVGMGVAPNARLDDGRFDVRVFRGFSKPELLRHLAQIAFGRYHYAPRVSTYRSARVRAISARPLPARADSLDLGTTPVEFRVRPRALRVVVSSGDAVTAPSASR